MRCKDLILGQQISIHALREEGDNSMAAMYLPSAPFLSTPSARRATLFEIEKQLAVAISIHALREEGDADYLGLPTKVEDFYPRPPRGGRRNTSYQRAMADIFLSTPSARRATQGNTAALSVTTIFLSTPSARRATVMELGPIALKTISIHALREEGDNPSAQMDAMR